LEEEKDAVTRAGESAGDEEGGEKGQESPGSPGRWLIALILLLLLTLLQAYLFWKFSLFSPHGGEMGNPPARAAVILQLPLKEDVLPCARQTRHKTPAARGQSPAGPR